VRARVLEADDVAVLACSVRLRGCRHGEERREQEKDDGAQVRLYAGTT
jgi:hypothetical protein